MQRPRFVARLQRKLVEHDHARREIARAGEERFGVDVLRRLLEHDDVVRARFHGLERNALKRELVAVARTHHRDLLLVRRDAFCVVAEVREAEESGAEADADFEHAGGWRREAREQQLCRALLRDADRFLLALEQRVVEIRHASSSCVRMCMKTLSG